MAGIEAKKISGKPLVAHVHATEFDRTGNNNINKDVFAIEKLGMQRADRVITVSNFTKKIVINRYDINPKKVDVVYNGVNPDDFQPLPKQVKKLKNNFEKIVLYVGRLTLQKGPDYFLKAAKRVLMIDPNVTFIIAGSVLRLSKLSPIIHRLLSQNNQGFPKF